MTHETGDQRPSFGYDIFLSHNHADGELVSAIADRLANHYYNMRPLRPWLDAQVLDRGPLDSDRELFSALDRSRLLAIVLRPEAVQSEWVRKELDYFLLRPALRQPKSVEKTVLLSGEAAAAFQALAYDRGESMEALIRDALEAYARRTG